MEEEHALDFLRQFDSEHTKRNYKSALRDLFQVAYGERNPVESLADKYIREERNYQRDVQELLVALKGRAPKTIRTKMSAVKMFLVENDVEFKERFWRRLGNRIPGHEAISEEIVPTPEECRRLLNFLPIGGRALFMVLLSSGMRIGEALGLLPGDVDWETDPVMITIRREIAKNRRRRPTFLSCEAVEVVQEWMKVRDAYVKTAVRRSFRRNRAGEVVCYKNDRDERLFPFSHSNAYVIWSNMLEKAGEPWNEKDPVTRRYKMHPHVLRKYFRSHLPAATAPERDMNPVDVTEALMGHGTYLTRIYRKFRVEQIAEFYKQGEHTLHIFTEAKEVGKLRKEMEERNKELRMRDDYLVRRNLELDQKIASLKEDLKEGLIDMRRKNEIRESRFNWFMEKLARTRNIGDAIEEFRRLEENPKPKEDNIKIVQGEEALVTHLKQGWTLVKELNHDKYLLKSIK